MCVYDRVMCRSGLGEGGEREVGEEGGGGGGGRERMRGVCPGPVSETADPDSNTIWHLYIIISSKYKLL